VIHRIHEADAFEMLARGIPREAPLTALDLGAHVGAVSTRIREVFPRSRVFAFEPAPGPFEVLRGRASEDPGIVPVQAAVGDREGEIVLRETRNPLLSSVLEPTDRTRALSFGAAEVVAETRVRLRRVDTWAGEAGVDRIDLVKLDVQGYELAALRGMGSLLGGVSAVFAEAHLEPGYEGAATFTDIDLYLRAQGLLIHQIHELTTRGDDLQTLQVDALWVRDGLLRVIRESPLERVTPPSARALLGGLERCARLGHRRIALYGGGTHTRAVAPWFGARETVEVVAILDDDRGLLGMEIAGVPIHHPGEIGRLGVEAVLISSDSFEDLLWRRAQGLRGAGVPVFRLYGREA
jgi:FkbM family methyltransferase